MISWRNVQQSTDRIARTVGNLAISRAFSRAVFSITTTRRDDFIDRYHSTDRIPTGESAV
jgi:hypothetical protein